MTAAELVAFLAAKGKFIAVEDGFQRMRVKSAAINTPR